MRNKVVQLSLFDTYTDVLNSMEENKSELINLLEERIDFDTIIPYQFKYAYYKRYGRKHINSLESFIRALFLQRLLGMKQNKQLLILLRFSKELRDFCGFNKLPDDPQITRETLIKLFVHLACIFSVSLPKKSDGAICANDLSLYL